MNFCQRFANFQRESFRACEGCHRLLFHYEDVIGLYYDVLRGRETYQTFYGNAKGIIKGSIKDLLRKAFSTQ